MTPFQRWCRQHLTPGKTTAAVWLVLIGLILSFWATLLFVAVKIVRMAWGN